jgi:hypothetical protein
MTYANRIRPRMNWLLIPALGCALGMGGCASQMYGGTPSDMSASMAPQYAPGTYEPPYQVGGARDDDAEPVAASQQWAAEQRYEYRGGRDPVTGRAKTQM